MADYNGGSYPSGNQFPHELSYTNDSYIGDEQNQQPDHDSNDTEAHQNNSRHYNSRACGGVSVNMNNLDIPATVDQYQGPGERRHEVAEIGALRAYHRALKADAMKTPSATRETMDAKMADVEPVVVTFVDKRNGVEYDAFGQIIPPLSVDGRTQSTAPEDSDDAILPHPDQLPEGDSKYSPYGNYNPSSYNPPYHSQERSITQQNVQPYPSQSTYGFDQPPTNPMISDHHVPPPQYPVQSYPEWQGGTYYPHNANLTGQPYVYNQPLQKIGDHLCCSVLVFLFCCWPCGVAAIIKAVKANESARQGKYAEAKKHAQSAKTCIVWGVILGIGCYILIGVSSFLRAKSSS